MINNSRGKDFQAKQEENTKESKLPQPTTTATSTSRQWAGFKNPRIVRVSRTFGGKDRHSKVCTVRGLRDRRIRLSVPTAIQLYDLQDRLGLSQPSKVVDWLLDATKDEIDKLPPLQMPPGNFGQFHQSNTIDPRDLNVPQSSHLSPFFNLNSSGGIKINENDENIQATGKSKYWDMDSSSSSRGKCKEVERESIGGNKWIASNEQDNHGGNRGYMEQLSAQNFFPVVNQPFPGLLNNSIPFNSYHNHWEPSNLSLSQFGSQGLIQSQTDPQNSSHHSLLLPSSLALPSASQLFLTPSIFPQYSVENDPRQLNHFQHVLQNSFMPNLHLISPLNVYPKIQSQNNEDSHHDKSKDRS